MLSDTQILNYPDLYCSSIAYCVLRILMTGVYIQYIFIIQMNC
jgi:hypothetical protein